MKKILLVALLCLPVLLKAQRGVVFKMKYMPDRNYQVSGKISLKLTATASGDSTFADKLKAEGITQPINGTGSFVTSGSLISGSRGPDGSFPLTIQFKVDSLGLSLGGKEVPIPPSISEKSLKVMAHVGADGMVAIDSIDGRKADDTTKKKTEQMMGFFLRQIQFPDGALKPGDTFSRSAPLNMNASRSAVKDIHMNLSTTFKLTNISGNNAFFDIVPSFSMSFNALNTTVNLSGTGLTKMIYSIKDNFPISRTGNLNVGLKVDNEKIKIDANVAAAGNTSTAIK